MYPNYGIVEVKAREKKELGGHKLDVYLLETNNKRQTFMVPATTAEKSGLRRLIKPEDVEKLLAILKQDPTQMKMDWYDRYRVNEDKLKTGILKNISEIVRDLWHVREANERTSREYHLRLDALAFLVDEIAYVQKRRKSEVSEVIDLIMRDKVVYEE